MTETRVAVRRETAADLFEPQRFQVMREMAQVFLASGMLPETIKRPEHVITIMVKGAELGIPPMAALSGINVIRGKPVTSPQLMLSMALRSGQLVEHAIEGDESQCTVMLHRKGGKPQRTTFTIRDAQLQGLTGKDNWKRMPRLMLQWRAVAEAMRKIFPDVIDGMYTPEELGADVKVSDDGEMTIVDSTAQDAPAQVSAKTGSAQRGAGRLAVAEAPAPKATEPEHEPETEPVVEAEYEEVATAQQAAPEDPDEFDKGIQKTPPELDETKAQITYPDPAWMAHHRRFGETIGLVDELRERKDRIKLYFLTFHGASSFKDTAHPVTLAQYEKFTEWFWKRWKTAKGKAEILGYLDAINVGGQ